MSKWYLIYLCFLEASKHCGCTKYMSDRLDTSWSRSSKSIVKIVAMRFFVFTAQGDYIRTVLLFLSWYYNSKLSMDAKISNV